MNIIEKTSCSKHRNKGFFCLLVSTFKLITPCIKQHHLPPKYYITQPAGPKRHWAGVWNQDQQLPSAGKWLKPNRLPIRTKIPIDSTFLPAKATNCTLRLLWENNPRFWKRQRNTWCLLIARESALPSWNPWWKHDFKQKFKNIYYFFCYLLEVIPFKQHCTTSSQLNLWKKPYGFVSGLSTSLRCKGYVNLSPPNSGFFKKYQDTGFFPDFSISVTFTCKTRVYVQVKQMNTRGFRRSLEEVWWQFWPLLLGCPCGTQTGPQSYGKARRNKSPGFTVMKIFLNLVIEIILDY